MHTERLHFMHIIIYIMHREHNSEFRYSYFRGIVARRPQDATVVSRHYFVKIQSQLAAAVPTAFFSEQILS